KYWFGRAAYLLAGAWWLPRAPLFECTIRADGEETRLTAVVVLVVNAGMLGAAPFRFAPNIAIDDGWLDICVYRPRTGRERASVTELGGSRLLLGGRGIGWAAVAAPIIGFVAMRGPVRPRFEFMEEGVIFRRSGKSPLLPWDEIAGVGLVKAGGRTVLAYRLKPGVA